MTWGRIDDDAWCHARFGMVRAEGYALFWAMNSYSNSQLLDGHLTESQVRAVGTFRLLSPDQITAAIENLVDAGLWQAEATGYNVHDYFDYNDSKAEILERRQRNAERQKVFRDKRGGHPINKEVRNAVTNAVTNSASNTPPNPMPIPLSTNVDSGAEVAAPHDAAASAAPPPLSFLDRYVGRLETETKNRNGVLGAAYAELFGSCSRQQHGRLGALARDNGAVKTLKAAMKAAAEVDPRADDPIAYMAGILKSKNGATRESPYLTDEEHEEVRKRQAEFQRGYGVQV